MPFKNSDLEIASSDLMFIVKFTVARRLLLVNIDLMFFVKFIIFGVTNYCLIDLINSKEHPQAGALSLQ